MKKKNLKGLSLNKKSISTLNQVSGGTGTLTPTIFTPEISAILSCVTCRGISCQQPSTCQELGLGCA